MVFIILCILCILHACVAFLYIQKHTLREFDIILLDIIKIWFCIVLYYNFTSNSHTIQKCDDYCSYSSYSYLFLIFEHQSQSSKDQWGENTNDGVQARGTSSWTPIRADTTSRGKITNTQQLSVGTATKLQQILGQINLISCCMDSLAPIFGQTKEKNLIKLGGVY